MIETTFNATEYWLSRGKGYIHEARLQAPFYVEQESFIVETVQSLNPASILEIGCGFARVTKRLAEAMPTTDILGVDLSPAQIESARDYCKLPNTTFALGDVNAFIPGGYDSVLAVEVLLHIPPDCLGSLIRRIFSVARVLIHDFDRNWLDRGSPHVFNHDYARLYSELGLRHMTIDRESYALMVVTK